MGLIIAIDGPPAPARARWRARLADYYHLAISTPA